MDLDFARILALDPDLNRAFYQAQAQARIMDHDFDLELDRLCGLAHNLDERRIQILAQAFNLNLAHVLSLARNHTLVLSLIFALARVHSFTRPLDLAHALTHALARDFGPTCALVLVRDLNQILDRARGLKADLLEVADFLRWYIRLATLTVAAEWRDVLAKQSESWAAQFRPGSRSLPAMKGEGQRAIYTYLDFYIDFVILEERIRGNLPAFEGIRIVKERKLEAS